MKKMSFNQSFNFEQLKILIVVFIIKKQTINRLTKGDKKRKMMMINKRMIMNGMGLLKISNIKNVNFNTQVNKKLNDQFKMFFSTQKKNNNNSPNQPDIQKSSKNDNSNAQTNQQQPQSQQQNQFTPQQEQLIKTYEPDEIFNTLINLDANHNFQKDLILAKKSYERSTKQLRASILFEDLLKSQVIIPVYDTKGKPYTHFWIKNLFNISFLCLTIWLFKQFQNKDPKNKVLLQRTSAGKFIKSVFIGLASWFVIVSLWKYLKFQRRFVQSIVYDTKTQSFTLKKRGFFGSTYSKQVSRFKLVYTENEFLNKKGTNYFNLDTKEQYSIPYKDSWIKQDLFSHLIAQRIKL